MLNSMREASQSSVVKILILVLIASFALWGIGDIFRGTARQSIAKVGDETISIRDFQTALTAELANYRRIFGADIPQELMRVIEMNTLNNFIEQALLRDAATHMGLRATDDEVIRRIQDNAAFQQDGMFNAERFSQILQANRYSEEHFVEMVRSEAMVEPMISSLTKARFPSSISASLLHRYDEETRVVDVIRLPLGSVSVPDTVNEPSLLAFFEDKKHEFIIPEFRGAQILRLNKEQVADEITLTEADIQSYYEQNQTLYLDDTGAPKPLDAVEKEIRKALMAEKTENVLYELSIEIEDALAGGATLEEVSKNFAIPLKVITPINQTGQTPDGTQLQDSVLTPSVISQLFVQEEGGDIRLEAQEDGSYMAMAVHSVVPPRTPALDEVRARVVKEWKAAEQQKALQQKADRYVEELSQGVSAKELAQKYNLPAPKRHTLERNEPSLEVPSSLRQESFGLNVGQPTGIHTNDLGELLIGQLREIQTPPAPEGDVLAAKQQSVSSEIQQDLSALYGKALRRMIPVDVYYTPTQNSADGSNE